MRLWHSFSTLVVCASLACSSAPPTAQPEIRTRGKHTVQYEGPEIRAEVSHLWASSHLGAEWLVLKLTLIAADGQSTVVERDEVRIRTPEGQTLATIDHQEFQRLEGEMRAALNRMVAWGPPSARFMAFEEPCDMWFVAPRNSYADRSSLRLQSNRWCSGPLIFHVPVGVQPGRWVLTIELEESEARIPFVLEE